MFSHLNFLSNFLMGAWLSWNPLAQICAAALLKLLLMVQYAPKSLNYLVYTITDAKNTFQWLKGDGIDVSFKLAVIQMKIHNSRSEQVDCKSVLLPKKTEPNFLICTLMFVNSDINHHLYAVVSAVVQLTASFAFGRNELGRRPLLMTSGITMSFRLSVLNSLSFIERLLIFEIMAVWTTCPYYVFSCFSVHSPVSRPLLGKLNPLEFGLRDIFYYNI